MKRKLLICLTAICAALMAGCSGQKTDADNKDAAATADFSTDAASAKEKISLDQAKSIALKEAGLSEKDGKWKKEELDREDGRQVYDLEFVSGEREYEFEIDAQTGAVVEFKKESVHD